MLMVCSTRSVHGLGGCVVGLLSLIPCLIKRVLHVCGGGLWVWLGGTLLLLGSNMVRCLRVAGGLAHCWVLRRHLLWVLFSGPPWVLLF